MFSPAIETSCHDDASFSTLSVLAISDSIFVLILFASAPMFLGRLLSRSTFGELDAAAPVFFGRLRSRSCSTFGELDVAAP
eukprot:10474523-Lingulodinium_polyedra.AAC.1